MLRVAKLFWNRPELILEFNTFMPEACSFDCSTSAYAHIVSIATPQGMRLLTFGPTSAGQVDRPKFLRQQQEQHRHCAVRTSW